LPSFPLSPGVLVTEYDLTNIIPAVSTSPGALAGVYSWGPVDERTLIDSEATYVARFGTPTSNNFETWFTGSSFLAYTNALFVVRAANTTSTNASEGYWNAVGNTGAANVVASTTKNRDHYLAKEGTYDSNILYLAKYPGVAGNSLRVSVVDSVNAYSSNLALVNSTANGVLSINAGSNTATVSVVPVGNGTITEANAMATQALANLAVGDLISVGNSTIGTQYVKISALSAIGSNSTESHFTISLVNPYRLAVDWSSNTVSRYWEFASVIGVAPGQSAHVTQFGNSNPSLDELHAVVVDEKGYFTGTPGTILEVYQALSRATDAKKLDGEPNYYKTVLNTSKYIWWANDRSGSVSNTSPNVANSTNYGVLNLVFNGGNDGAPEGNVSIQEVTRAYDYFASPEESDISLVMTGKSIGGIIGEQLGNYLIDNISETRKDCVVFISPNKSAVVDNWGSEVQSLLDYRAVTRSSSYGFLDSGYKQMYDKYNNVYRWVPLNGDMAGLCARTDETNDPWWAPAGYNRGRLKNVVKLAFNPNKTARDQIFPHNINPVVFFPDDGPVLFGDKTLQAKASAFDAINVRRLFIVLEKAIAKAAKYFLWEFNDEYTRAQFRNMVNPYLRTIQGRRGITGFLVKCDAKNNTPDLIDRNIMVGDIYIKPNRAIRNIQLNFIATPTGVSFSEVELGRGTQV
jgi:hypothetical protein